MKELVGHMFQFVLAYGVKDKERFVSYANQWLEQYQLEDKRKDELIEFAYEFISNMAARIQGTQVVASGVRRGVSGIAEQLEELNTKLEALSKKLPES